MLAKVHPILFHLGPVVIPSYGALAAAGVLLALLLAQRTARMTGAAPNQVWNLCVVALCAALVAARLALIVVNWRGLLHHPVWVLGLAMIHHPLLAAIGAVVGALAAFVYARWQRMPLLAAADALAAPVALAIAFEQLGALLAGSEYGTETAVRWAAIYNHPLALRWSGTPLGIPLHPVQAYAALTFLALATFLVLWMPMRRQQGDIAALGLLGGGFLLFMTEIWRDWEGRGAVLDGALDAPQIAAVVLVLAGALLLRERSPKAAGAESGNNAFSREVTHG